MSFFKTKYRIVTDYYLGYEVQCKLWWFPFWFQPSINTHPSVESARRYIERWDKRRGHFVEEYNPHFNTKEK